MLKTFKHKRFSSGKTPQLGFTLVELVVVIVVLGVVSISLSGIARNAMNAVLTISEREDLVREGSFLTERFKRELSSSVPNSVRIRGNALAHCIEFVPTLFSGTYLTLPLDGSPGNSADLIELSDIAGNAFTPTINDFAIVFPTNPDQVYSPTLGHRRAVVSCSDDSSNGNCTTLNDSDKVIQLEVSEGFAQTSPSRRVYFAREAVSYCMRGSEVRRHSGAITLTQNLYTSGGSLMARNLVNQLGISPTSGDQNPFKSVGALFNRNAATHSLFIFGREDERVTFMQEMQIPNVP